MAVRAPLTYLIWSPTFASPRCKRFARVCACAGHAARSSNPARSSKPVRERPPPDSTAVPHSDLPVAPDGKQVTLNLFGWPDLQRHACSMAKHWIRRWWMNKSNSEQYDTYLANASDDEIKRHYETKQRRARHERNQAENTKRHKNNYDPTLRRERYDPTLRRERYARQRVRNASCACTAHECRIAIPTLNLLLLRPGTLFSFAGHWGTEVGAGAAFHNTQ